MFEILQSNVTVSIKYITNWYVVRLAVSDVAMDQRETSLAQTFASSSAVSTNVSSVDVTSRGYLASSSADTSGRLCWSILTLLYRLLLFVCEIWCYLVVCITGNLCHKLGWTASLMSCWYCCNKTSQFKMMCKDDIDTHLKQQKIQRKRWYYFCNTSPYFPYCHFEYTI